MKKSEVLQWTPKMLADRTGVTVPTLHFYEEKGLIVSSRTTGNQRRYDRSMIRRISFIQAGQRAGITLAEVKKTLDKLPMNRTPNKSDWAKISREWTDLINTRIDHLESIREKFTSCIQCGCLSLESCAIYNPDDNVGTVNEKLNDL